MYSPATGWRAGRNFAFGAEVESAGVSLHGSVGSGRGMFFPGQPNSAETAKTDTSNRDTSWKRIHPPGSRKAPNSILSGLLTWDAGGRLAVPRAWVQRRTSFASSAMTRSHSASVLHGWGETRMPAPGRLSMSMPMSAN